MARSTQVVVIVGAAAVIGGLAWWMLGSGGAGGGGEGTGASRGPAPVAQGEAPGAGHPAKAAPALAVGTLRAVVRGGGKPLAATLAAGPAADPATEPVSAEGSAADGTVVLACAPAGTKLRVAVSAPGWRTLVLPDVAVDPGKERDLGTLDLERALPATGRVLDPTGKPVAGAAVGALVSEAVSRFDLRRIADLILKEPDWTAKATTGKDGTFSLDALGAGKWRLVATAQGFAPSEETEVVLHPAGTAPPVDLVLQTGSSLLVRVTGPGDSPAAGLEVAAAAQGGRMGMPVAIGPARGITDAAGTARLSGIPAGRTVVAVRTAEGRLAIRSADVPKSTEVAVRLEGTAVLLVKVKDGAGAALEGAAVTAILDDGGRGLDSGQALSAKTGPDGSVRWERLSAGRVMIVLAEKEGYPPPSPMGMFQGAGGNGPEQLKEGETLEKDVVLKAGATVTGTVRRRPGDAPVPGARVTLTGQITFFGGQPRTVLADAEGNYRMEGVPEGRATLVAAVDGAVAPGAWTAAAPAFGPPAREDGNPPEGSVDVPAAPGEAKRDLYVEATGTVSGRVLGPNGDGLGGARVEVGAKRAFFFRGMGPDSSLLPGPVLSAPDGSFLVPAVPAGQDLQVTASAPGLLDGTSSPFTLAVGGEAPAIEVRLTEGGSVAGHVTGASGAPVSGAKVRVSASRQPGPGRGGMNMMDSGGRGSLQATTDAEGHFRVAAVPPGAISLSVQADGFVDATRGDLVVAASTETRADVSLEPGRAIAGTVKDSAGAAVEGARLFARSEGAGSPGDMRFRNGITDAKGAFRLDGLPAGTFLLTVNAQGHATRTIPGVAAGNDSLEVVLPPAVRMSGKVVDSEGNPVGSVRISATAEGGDGSQAGGRSGADGTFTVEGLTAGTYRVFAQSFDGKYGRAEAKGIAGDATDVVLTLPKALEIRGKVVGPDGAAPAEQGFVRVVGTPGGPGPGSLARWEQDGSFVLGGLGEGSYTLQATLPGRFDGTATATAGQTGVEIRLQPAPVPAPDRGGGTPRPPR